jgi:hypothetical protein
MREGDSERNVFVEVCPGDGQPEISILMPIYRQLACVAGAVNSVLAQRGVVAEIIISDDASTDGTFEAASAAVRNWLDTHGSSHRIILRRGSTRLRRDHLALLIDYANCDLVCQAHGDDESHPDRARVLVETFQASPGATMVAVGSSMIKAEGAQIGEQWPAHLAAAVTRYSIEAIINGHPTLIGFSQAWRRSAVSRFTRLDSNYAPVAHDRILPFRAALTGEVLFVQAQLIKRRVHDTAWHAMMFDEPDTNGHFGWSLTKISCLRNMARDLDHARKIGLVQDQNIQPVSQLITQLLNESLMVMLEAFRLQTQSGRLIAWVDDDTLMQLRRERNRKK